MSNGIKIKEFISFYASDCRKRHSHRRIKDTVIEFVVQLEILIRGLWYPIIRYDTAHESAHCDILHWSGKSEKVAMPTLDYNKALTFADEDLNENWEIYREHFLKEVPNGER